MILLLLAFFVAQVNADGDNGDDISNNLFSDLAPLLALFGERVTMQFISQSMGWADNVLLAMAPIGIITTIVSAIRVGGPSWLKALVGRARENLAIAEAELMSSTSDEVCEVWNGKEVVRCMGSTPIREFIICIPSSRHGLPKITAMTLDEAIDQGYMKSSDLIMLLEDEDSGRRSSQSHPENGKKTPSDIAIIRNNFSLSPNVALNCHNRVKRGEVRTFAAIGTFLQTGVLLYSGFAANFAPLKLLKDGKVIEHYAYPCTVLGTVLLVAGMMLCAHVVESSTIEKSYHINEDCRGRFLWLQQEKKVSDQVFKSSALYAKDDRHIITTSARNGKGGAQTVLNLKAVLGTTISLCGFVIQFVGLRGMHWSASVVQLGSVLFMTALRALVRRGLAMPPGSETLAPGFELEWFAMTFDDVDNTTWLNPRRYEVARPNGNGAKSGNRATEPRIEKTWAVVTGDIIKRYEELSRVENREVPPSAAHRVMSIRRDLGQLSGWPGVASAEAIAVARSIEITMDTLFKHLRGNFTWSLPVYFKGTSQKITFRVDFQENGAWKSYADEIEAALSLWLYSVRQHGDQPNEEALSTSIPFLQQSGHTKDDAWLRARGPRAKLGLRILGPYTKSLHRDLQWWMPARLSNILRVTTNIGAEQPGTKRVPEPTSQSTQQRSDDISDEKLLEIQKHRIVGYASNSDPATTQPKSAKDPPTSAANFRYNSWELKELNFGMTDAPTHDLLAATSHAPLKLLYAQDIFASFMHSASMALSKPVSGDSDIIPSGFAGEEAWKSFTLSNHDIANMAQEIQSAGLGTLNEVSLSIVAPLSLQGKLPDVDQVLDLARKQAEPHERLNRWQPAADIHLWLFELGRTFPPSTGTSVKATVLLMEYLRSLTLTTMELLEEEKHRGPGNLKDVKELEKLRQKLEDTLATQDGGVLLNLMRLYDTQGRSWECPAVECTGQGSEIPRDFAAIFNFPDMLQNLLKGTDNGLLKRWARSNGRVKTIQGWTPLHYAVKLEDDYFAHVAASHSDVNSQDISGWAPLHYACENGNTSIAQLLLQQGADMDLVGRNGTTPLHCAAKGPHFEVFDLLLQAGANADVRDASGRTPLQWAAYKGHLAIVKQLAQQGNSNQRDQSGKSVLHLAVIGGQIQIVQLLVDLGAKREVKDRGEMTPLHWASAYGHLDAVKFLISDANKDEHEMRKWTALHLAAWNGHADIVRFLVLEVRADIEKQDARGRRPLHLAAEAGHLDVVKCLVAEKAEMAGDEEDNNTPLHMAAEAGHLEVVRHLVKAGADMKIIGGWYGTPLETAAAKGHLDVVRFLVKQTSALNDRDGGTQLYYSPSTACEDYDDDVGECEWTPLHLAAARGMVNGVKLLLGKKADLEAKNDEGRTPLHLAALHGQVEIVQLFIREGANTVTEDDKGKTVMDLARELRKEEIVLALS
ncbi:hypothetical protein NM208_g6000 [Fusarium decemcellulare]|uniref:Uncharacterized protein n=1 Tax=Fusarium decemcellulare TaxID=57161 RepID=A0ACC1SF53_9HYPO|nr:hypothetical protein NM208_g6000 [Fusarium decemcellulare]